MDYQATPPTLRTAVIERGHVMFYLESYALGADGTVGGMVSHSEPAISMDDPAIATHAAALTAALDAIQAHILGERPDESPVKRLMPVAKETLTPIEPIKETK